MVMTAINNILIDLKRIVVIDDDIIFRSLAALKLQRVFPESDIEVVADHQSAEIALKGKVDMVLLDINMPEEDAWGFIRRNESLLRGKRLIICSSSIDKNDLQKAADHPLVSGYVVKPLSHEGLMDAFQGIWPKEVKSVDKDIPAA